MAGVILWSDELCLWLELFYGLIFVYVVSSDYCLNSLNGLSYLYGSILLWLSSLCGFSSHYG